MLVIPAIDLRGGRVVRLAQGSQQRERRYDVDPRRIARQWAEDGAPWIHVVDLDGAFSGSSKQLGTIAGIVDATSAFVELGGGLRSTDAVEAALTRGVSRVVLGSLAVIDVKSTLQLIEMYGERIAIAIDARLGDVQIAGWTRSSGLAPLGFARRYAAEGAQRFVVTDVTCDGMLAGPNQALPARISSETGCRVIASGGVSRLDDVEALHGSGMEGVIVGTALFEGRFTLRQALQVAREISC